MDWFERLTGFRELDYATTRQNLDVDGKQLHSLVNGASYGIGEFELASLAALRERVQRGGGLPGKLQVSVVVGDVRRLHRVPEYADALFQVASQFNMLEMVSPQVTPEQGVTLYQHDHTQGPGCAIAAGAATIYRNYFVPVGDGIGQTKDHQLDGLAEIGKSLSESLGQSVESLWSMQNGYAMCSQAGLSAIAGHLAKLGPGQTDALRAKLRIGIHSDVEVTNTDSSPRPRVSQAFCSALPVAYSRVPASHWTAFATLVLEAAYEATMWAAVLNAQRGGSNIVLLTRVGGGVFGNAAEWIDVAMRRALRLAVDCGLDVRFVSHGSPDPRLVQMASQFGRGGKR